jgi:hypothetical protein
MKEVKTNKVIKKATEIMEGVYRQELPNVNVGNIVRLGDIWDGNGEIPETSYSYQVSEFDWLNYEFQIVEKSNKALETVVKITGIELL